jgi:hypothetical protein
LKRVAIAAQARRLVGPIVVLLAPAVCTDAAVHDSPIKFGLVWNVEKRTWVHWDGNTKSPIARNLLASLGLGAPLHGKRADLQFEMVKRQTDLTEKIRPPRYPFAINRAEARRGAPLFASNCDSCHGGAEGDKRLYSVAEIGTDPHRAEMFTQNLADGFNRFLSELEAEVISHPRKLECAAPVNISLRH